MTLKHILAFAFSAAFCTCAFAQNSAQVRILLKNGSEVSFTQGLEKSGNTSVFKMKKEDIPANTRFLEVRFDFAKAKKGDSGYWVLSDGRLGTFKCDNGRIVEPRNPMPLFGVVHNNKAYAAIVKGLKYNFSMSVDAKDGNYEIYPIFNISQMHRPPHQDIEIAVSEFSGEDADYSAIARAYRKYQLDRGEVQPLAKRAQTRPTLKYAVGSIYLRFSMSRKDDKVKIEDQTLENEPPLKVNMTFDDTIKVLKRLGEMGVKDVDICYVGWNVAGIDGRFPTLFPVEEKLGGEAKMRESMALAKSLGYQTVVHTCNTDFYTISDRFDINDIARDHKGNPRRGKHVFAGGRPYNPCFEQVYKKYISKDVADLKNLGDRGLHHIDVTSCITPWDCHSPKHPCTRDDTAMYMNKIGLLCRDELGGFASEGPCDHVANSLDYALYVSSYPRYLGKATTMMDKIIPLWQIAYHGIILSNPFYSTIDPFYNPAMRSERSKCHTDPEERWLKIVEFGGRPTFYTSNFKSLEPIKRAADEYKKVRHLQWFFMDKHAEIAPNVFLTKYSDGSKTVCNYTDSPYTYDGKTVAPKNYILLSPKQLH